MSKVDETVEAINTVKDTYQKARENLDAAISTAEEGRALGEAVGYEGVQKQFQKAKDALDKVSVATAALEASLDSIAAAVQADV